LQLETLFVHHPVMSAAEEDQVGQRRLTAITPVLAVMRVAPGWWVVTAARHAVAIP